MSPFPAYRGRVDESPGGVQVGDAPKSVKRCETTIGYHPRRAKRWDSSENDPFLSVRADGVRAGGGDGGFGGLRPRESLSRNAGSRHRLGWIKGGVLRRKVE